jgi:plasmid segregation protein ParM
MSNTTPVIRAIDVGYGNTKYIRTVENGQAIADHFPSIVHRPAGGKPSFHESPDIYEVVVNKTTYEVGPGVDAALEGGLRIMHDNYIETEDYMALVYGALSQMKLSEIDLLVVGLPVDLMGSKREALQNRLVGEHVVCGETVNIKRVNAVAQPLGGFLHYASQNKMIEELNSTRNLLIDPGFFTVDFLVSTGLREIRGKSGSHPAGVSSYLKAVAKGLSREFQINYDNISHIDEGIRKGKFRLYGKDVDLSQYHEQALAEIAPAVDAISNKIGDGRSIDQVILVGGGAKLFESSIKNLLPQHRVHCDEYSVVANVLGFQKIGEAWAAHNSRVA